MFLTTTHTNSSLNIVTLEGWFYNSHYVNIGYFFICSFFLSVIMFSLAFLLSISNLKDAEKLSEYECGFEPFDNATRHPFDVHFYVVGILFLIFDVEIAILFP